MAQPPLVVLAVGVATVLGMMIILRLHAFLALMTAAIVVSFLSPGETAQIMPRVAEAFGKTAGNIGIVIALAAIIGRCLMESGAADRVVQALLGVFGLRRSSAALATSGFVLSAPVFFDTVFYLLVPLARSLYRQTQRDYVRYVMAICAGGVVTHTLVPPTPGPLVVADTLGVDFGVMILVGSLIGVPMTAVGLAFAAWTNRRMPIAMRPLAGSRGDEGPPADRPLPSLAAAAAPVVLPVALIAANTFLQRLATDAAADSLATRLAPWAAVVGNANFALAVATIAAMAVYVRQCRPSRHDTAALVEDALASGAVIILITAAGGAFGAMLKEAQLGPAIETLFGRAAGAQGPTLLVTAFGLCAVLKFSQGSSTVAMVTSSSMLASMIDPAQLPFHPVYLATAIGSGSIVGSWMNDSGFWIYCKMGGFTEVESLKSWTPLLALIGCTGLLATLALSQGLPLRAVGAVVNGP